VNALLGASLLPTAVVPLTAIATFIGWRPEPLIRVLFLAGGAAQEFEPRRPEEIREILFRFVAEESNPENRFGVERVELFYPAPILADGTVLIDTPGIGSTLTHNTETAMRVLPECDASLFVVSADPPITQVEIDYLHRLKPKIGRIFFILNKVDYLDAEERETVVSFLRKVLREQNLIEAAGAIFGVSARLGLAAKERGDERELQRSGMAEIEQHLIHYLATEKTQLLEQAIRKKAADALAQAIGELELRARALDMPLQELQDKASGFAQALRQIEGERLTIADLLAGDRRRLINDLEQRVEQLRADVRAKLRGLITQPGAAAGWEEMAKTAVANALEESFAAAQGQFVERFSAEVAAILSRHWQRVDALAEKIRGTAADMFQVTLPPAPEVEEFKLDQEPYWVTEKIQSTLLPDAGKLVDRLVPAAARRRRREARMIEESNELVLRNAESLRWAILRGVDETFRNATAQFEEELDRTLAATKGVIDGVIARRRDQSFAVEKERADLDRGLQQLGALRAEFAA
jgi:hypothetical protein